MENLIAKLNWRYAVKKYDTSKKVSTGDLQLLKESVRLAPSSFGLQPYRFLFIENAGLREELKTASYLQPQVTDASCLVVIAIESNLDGAFVNQYFERVCKTRNTVPEGSLLKYRDSVLNAIARKSPEEKLHWATHQAYLALGFLLQAAAELQIDANAMEGFIPEKYDEILGLKARELHAVVIAALGYRHPGDYLQGLPKVRKAENELFINL